MSNLYKKIHNTLLTGSAILLTSFMVPQIANAATTESFAIDGELRNSTLNNVFFGATFTGTFDLDLDARYVSDIGTAMYDLSSWNILLTANNGESFEFSQGESEDSAKMYLQPGYDFIAGYDMLTLNFAEDNSNNTTTNLQISFNTDYNITTNTTLTELLNGDPEMGTPNQLRNGSNIQNLQENNIFLESASFAPKTEETVSPVPEASTLAMLGLGSLMVFGLARRNRKSPNVKSA